MALSHRVTPHKPTTMQNFKDEIESRCPAIECSYQPNGKAYTVRRAVYRATYFDDERTLATWLTDDPRVVLIKDIDPDDAAKYFIRWSEKSFS